MPTPKQIEIQNALRILTRVMADGTSIEFCGNDIVDLSGMPEGHNGMVRTQEAAEAIHWVARGQ